MREGQFIKQNKDRWDEYEHMPTDDPDELAKRFTNLVDDLSYAKTFYPFGNTAQYINNLASNIYLSIYKKRREKSNRIKTFWTIELPVIIRRNHKIFLFSLCFFLAFVLLGLLSSATDQTFVRAVLGDGYVDMTESNIASGDPFGVYKDADPFYMFVRIAANNIAVSFKMCIAGLLASVGTLFFLFVNGLMVGVFEHLFIQHGLGVDFFLVVFIHGTLELSGIVIAGAAGLIIGNSLLFPKTHSRWRSLRLGVKDGVKVILVLIPIDLIAAFFESYVTRHTEMPLVLSLLILFGSLAAVVFYFIIYPIKIGRRFPHLLDGHKG